MATKQTPDDEQVIIQGPSGDLIQIGRAEFEGSHYAEQDYEIAGPVPVDEPELEAEATDDTDEAPA